ncbi:hypothetical protein EBR66_06845 [bacterium]|nr:hypothetical protein [bacterium]
MEIVNGGGCASCYSFTSERLVDFGAAFDGPVLETGMQIDDLVLCEGCVLSAANALSLSPSQATDLRREADEARVLAERWKAYAEKLEDGLAVRPEKKGSPKLKAAA